MFVATPEISKLFMLGDIPQVGTTLAPPPINSELLPSIFISPFTFSLESGFVIPIPTLVPSSNIIAPVLPIVVADVNLAT